MKQPDSAFSLLAEPLQRWVFKKGWDDLLPIQKQAVRPVMEGRSDIIISASTASGKTEAAFLPALSAVSGRGEKEGIRILYISPLKALINDQARRIEDMAEGTGLPVTPWHGDISSSRKGRLSEHPAGVLLTTPESLESMLINRAAWLKEALSNLSYFIIDEFHAFMGTQRGYQLQSQLHRIDNICQRLVPRVALSATFSDCAAAQSCLRPQGGVPCLVITGGERGDRLAVQIRGYDGPPPRQEEEKRGRRGRDQGEPMGAYRDISADIFRLMRGTTNLVFCNSRMLTESIATELQRLSEANFVPNEFFPHHGSLSRELRESLEQRLIEGRLPTTAVCTATLELGIDISDVHSIAQIDPPLSVASLRQRLGRSGRRDHLAVLRLFIPESTVKTDSFNSRNLCEGTFLSAAMIKLLLEHWYEPPLEHEYAFSTLLQQTLSVIASRGSASARNLYALLCKTGPFSLCTSSIFAQFLHDLGDSNLITQLADGTLALGTGGEDLVSSWGFYSAFQTPDEFAIEHDGRVIGRVPVSQPLELGMTFLFAGRGWKIVFLSDSQKIIGVKPYPHTTLPLVLGGAGGRIHDKLRSTMFEMYCEGKIPEFLNRAAHLNFARGLMTFDKFDLEHCRLMRAPDALVIYPWRGDRVMRTMQLMLRRKNCKCRQYGSHLHLAFTSEDTLAQAVRSILDEGLVDGSVLASRVENLNTDKHDKFISAPLKRLSYAWSSLDIKGALECFEELSKELKLPPSRPFSPVGAAPAAQLDKDRP
ncbi:MAG: DEAD/DEAH box helicase [Succinivibrio sp.]